MKITDTWLQTAIAKNRGKPKYRKTVDRGPARPGLMVTVYSDGTAAFVMRYTRPGGARVFMPIGAYGKAGLSLAEVCTAHDGALSQLEKGLDPVEERERRENAERRNREERAGADTVSDLVQRFVSDQLASRKRPEAAAQLLKTNLVEARIDGQVIGKMKARDITRRQLVRLLDGIKARPAPITANRVHALLVQMFKWAAAREDIPASPMYGVPRPTSRERPRDRVLTAEEIRTFWTKLDSEDIEMALPTKLALRLLLVTAQRRGEITQAKWSHFDLDGKLWTIPVALLKSSHTRREKPEPHRVPLSSLAIELLEQLSAITGEGVYLLPQRADKRKDKSYSERVLSRAVRENAKELGIEHFTPHDLRRTAASFMTKLKIPRLHVEKVLNHSTGDIAEVYDRHDYMPEKRAALETWSEHLSAIIARREKVVPLVRHG